MGKIVMANPNFSSLQVAVIAMITRARGWGFYEKLAKNDTIIVQGNEQALNLVKSGERPIAAATDAQYANAARFAGFKIYNFFPSDGTFAIPSYTCVVKGSKNPNAAKLMAEYTLSQEAQKLWPASGVYAARTDVDPPAGSAPIKDIKVIAMDYAYIRKQSTAVKKRFSEIFSI
jgi:iron(III) transport system substrate-binding protein